MAPRMEKSLTEYERCLQDHPAEYQKDGLDQSTRGTKLAPRRKSQKARPDPRYLCNSLLSKNLSPHLITAILFGLVQRRIGCLHECFGQGIGARCHRGNPDTYRNPVGNP